MLGELDEILAVVNLRRQASSRYIQTEYRRDLARAEELVWAGPGSAFPGVIQPGTDFTLPPPVSQIEARREESITYLRTQARQDIDLAMNACLNVIDNAYREFVQTQARDLRARLQKRGILTATTKEKP
jgi:hypothetical protein